MTNMILGVGHGAHVESSLRGLTLCGRQIDVDRDDVRRESYVRPTSTSHDHATMCVDCFDALGPRGFRVEPQEGEP